MKRIFTLLLILTLLTAMAVGCNEKSEPEPSLAGSWVITSFILPPGGWTARRDR